MTDTDRATAWAKMTKSQRLQFIKSGQRLDITSGQRQTAVAHLKRQAGQQ